VTHPLFKEHRLQGDKVVITLETTAENVGYFNCTSQFLSCWELRLQNNHFDFRMSVRLPWSGVWFLEVSSAQVQRGV
jgi:hypothetical protein